MSGKDIDIICSAALRFCAVSATVCMAAGMICGYGALFVAGSAAVLLASLLGLELLKP